MKKAVIYARYSCDRQNEQSIDGQMRVCKDYADKNGITIVDTYVDKAMSGTNDNRADFQRMLRDSDRKEWDYVLIYKLDRFSRNKYEMAIHRKHLKDNGIKILSAMENIPDSPEGILLESLLEGMNQYYSEELSQKTKRGLNESRLKGNFCGGTVTYGYALNGQKVIINEQETHIVQHIFNEYAAGKQAIVIARELYDRGVLYRGNNFRVNTVYRILRQEKYIGIYRVNDVIYDKIYPPIVPVDVYNIVKARIDANKYGKHPKNNVRYLLKGRIYCGYCGRHMVSFTGTSKSGEMRRYYRCHKYDFCEQSRTVQKDVLENAIVSTLQHILGNGDNFDTLLDIILDSYNGKLNDLTALRLAEKELAKVEKSLSNLVAAIEAGLLTETTKARLQELEESKRTLSEVIAVEKSKEKKLLTKDDIGLYVQYALSQPNQTLIDLLVDKVVIYNDKIELFLKYTDTSDDPPKRGKHKASENPERNISERGSFLGEYVYEYTVNINGRKPRIYIPELRKETRYTLVRVLV